MFRVFHVVSVPLIRVESPFTQKTWNTRNMILVWCSQRVDKRA